MELSRGNIASCPEYEVVSIYASYEQEFNAYVSGHMLSIV